MTSTHKVNTLDDSVKTSYETMSKDNLECITFKSKFKGETRKVSLLKYNGQELIMESPEIKTTHYGIPSSHEKYAPTDDKREYAKVPLNPKQSDNVETFVATLNEIDEFLSSNEVKLKVLGDKKASKYTYVPIVRSPHIDEDEEDEEKIAKAKANPNYCKMNFYKPYNSKSGKIKTRFINVTKNEDGSEKLKRIRFNTIDELQSEVRYQASNRYVFSFGSIWTQPALKTYGVTLKLLELYTEKPAMGGGSVVSQLNDSDSEDEEEVSSASEEPPSKEQTQQVFTNEEPKNDSDSDSDSESSEDEEEEPPKPEPVAKRTRGRKAKSNNA